MPYKEVIKLLAHLSYIIDTIHYVVYSNMAISSVHDKVDGYEVDQNPMVSRILHKQLPQPRYSETWER